MPLLNTKHKKKSAVITALILLLMLFVIFNYGMAYLDPPQEYGLAINFGDSNVGSGKKVEKIKQKTVPEKVVEKVQEEPVEEIKEEVVETPQEVVKEKVITKETIDDVPVVEKVKEVKKEVTPKKEVIKKNLSTPLKETKKKEQAKKKPTPSKATQNALNNLFGGNKSDGKPKGEGDDKEKGVKGKKDGDPNSSKYYGNKGSGEGGNYNLAGRKALSKPIEKPDCQEEGIVVVSIEVDKTGRVIRAIAGVKGSANTAPCLLKPAKAAALKTKWNADGKAPSKQKGTIIYQFSLSE